MGEYYVYEWIRLDTNEPFYVGKGKGKRCYRLDREYNEHFNNIVKSIPVAVNILYENLEEDFANGLEVWYIREYRDIIGYDLCNIADGGEGHGLAGKNHPRYGKHLSNKTKNKTSNSMKGKFIGGNSPLAKSVICITTNKIFPTAREGACCYNCKYTNISSCCKGKRRTCGKLLNGTRLIWKYLDDFLNLCKYITL